MQPTNLNLNMLVIPANDPRFNPYIWADQLPAMDGQREAEKAVAEKERNAKHERSQRSRGNELPGLFR